MVFWLEFKKTTAIFKMHPQICEKQFSNNTVNFIIGSTFPKASRFTFSRSAGLFYNVYPFKCINITHAGLILHITQNSCRASNKGIVFKYLQLLQITTVAYKYNKIKNKIC